VGGWEKKEVSSFGKTAWAWKGGGDTGGGQTGKREKRIRNNKKKKKKRPIDSRTKPTKPRGERPVKP